MHNLEKKQIAVIGPNAAWQKTIKIAKFAKGEINRAAGVSYCAAGKGINFARAVKIWGNGVNAKLFQFAGGKTGKLLCNALDAEGLKNKTINVHAETRTCTTCLSLDDKIMTEIIEPSESLGKNAEKEIFNLIFVELVSKGFVALCGTLPSGISLDFYARITTEAVKLGIPVFLDAVQYVDGALTAGVNILKVNENEIKQIGGKKNIASSANECFKKYPVKNIAVTAGADHAFLFTRENGNYEYAIPPIKDVISPLGAGDVTGAVMLVQLCSGKNISDSFSMGLAAGSASCLTDLPGFFDVKTASYIFQKIKRKKI